MNRRTRTRHLFDLHEGEVEPGGVVPGPHRLRRVGLGHVTAVGEIFAGVEFHGISLSVVFDVDSLSVAEESRTRRLFSILRSKSFCINVLLFSNKDRINDRPWKCKSRTFASCTCDCREMEIRNKVVPFVNDFLSFVWYQYF